MDAWFKWAVPHLCTARRPCSGASLFAAWKAPRCVCPSKVSSCSLPIPLLGTGRLGNWDYESAHKKISWAWTSTLTLLTQVIPIISFKRDCDLPLWEAGQSSFSFQSNLFCAKSGVHRVMVSSRWGPQWKWAGGAWHRSKTLDSAFCLRLGRDCSPKFLATLCVTSPYIRPFPLSQGWRKKGHFCCGAWGMGDRI